MAKYFLLVCTIVFIGQGYCLTTFNFDPLDKILDKSTNDIKNSFDLIGDIISPFNKTISNITENGIDKINNLVPTPLNLNCLTAGTSQLVNHNINIAICFTETFNKLVDTARNQITEISNLRNLITKTRESISGLTCLGGLSCLLKSVLGPVGDLISSVVKLAKAVAKVVFDITIFTIELVKCGSSQVTNTIDLVTEVVNGVQQCIAP